METDHIGLLLLATAGYHPCVAPCPLVYEKLVKITRDDSALTIEDDCLSPVERAQFLSQADLMNEALELYKGVIIQGSS
jgi:metalloendopeptidase OMA1, mitochondrial